MKFIKVSSITVICISFLLLDADMSIADKTEIEELKSQMKQMQQQMTEMQEKINALEKRNVNLRKKIVEKEVEEKQKPGTRTGTASRGKSFPGKAFQTLNPDISAVGIFSAAYYSEDDPLLTAEADPENTGINLQELELGFRSVVDPYFRFDSFVSITQEHVELEEAYGTTLMSLPLNSQIRAGVMRSKFGRINTLHRHDQNFVTLPVVATRFLGEHFNPAGVEANFLLPVPWFSELTMAVSSPEVETPSFDRDGDSNNLGRLLYNFRLANFFELSESLGVTAGGSYATGSNGTDGGNRTNLFGLDLYAKYRPLKNSPYQEVALQTELMYRNAETLEGDLDDYGFYSQVVYRFAKRWRAGVRFGMVDTDDPLSMHEGENGSEHGDEHGDHEDEHDHMTSLIQLAQDDHEEEGHEHGDSELGLLGKEYRISAMLTFAPTEFSLLRLQYDYLDQDFAENQHALFLQFQYAIGAHGAHPF